MNKQQALQQANCIHPMPRREIRRTVNRHGQVFRELVCNRCDRILHTRAWDLTDATIDTDPRNSTGKFAVLDPSQVVE